MRASADKTVSLQETSFQCRPRHRGEANATGLQPGAQGHRGCWRMAKGLATHADNWQYVSLVASCVLAGKVKEDAIGVFIRER